MEDYLPEKTCRTCLQKSEDLTSLDSKDDDTGLTLLEKLRFCASMQVVMSERTPSNACAQCVRCIVEYYDFKRRCELSEKTLEDLYGEPSAFTATKFEVYFGEEEDADSTVVNETESKDFNLSCDADSNWASSSDGEEEVDCDTTSKNLISEKYPINEGKKLSVGHLDDLKKAFKNPCDICSSSFRTAEILQKHKTFWHSVIQHRCDQCDILFPTETHLRVHMKTHKKNTTYICETCGKVYKLEASLQFHIEENHAAEPKVYECKVCGKTYNFLGSLNSHKRTHRAPDPRFMCTCDRCGQTFANSMCLRRHVRSIHEKMHACDTCEKRFTLQSDLLKHKATHLKEMAKPYGCELCEKRFSKKSALGFHMSTLHRGKKNLKCDVCGMEFYNRFHYAAHYSKHTGVKPYKCNGCRKGFNYNRNLVMHKKKCASLLALAQQ